MRNPFTPAFGVMPLVLAGQDDLLADMRQALENGVGDPNLSTLVVGARGTGKTALLARIRMDAAAQGWISVGTTAIPGMLDDIEDQIRISARHILEPNTKTRLTSATVGPVDASWSHQDATHANWRTRITLILEKLAETDTGLLITVDEVNAELDEMIQLAAVYQHFVTEGRKVALIMAGLPYRVHQLVSDRSVSFLRRSFLRELDRIPDQDVFSALKTTFEAGGKQADSDALSLCTQAVEGFPYMLQLVGFRTWTESGDNDPITRAHAEQGIAFAKREFEQRVLDATYRELSDGDRGFLRAMLQDKRESRLADISQRMGVKSNYSTKYKTRLLAQGVIREVGRNVFQFEILGLRPYLEKRFAEEAWRKKWDEGKRPHRPRSPKSQREAPQRRAVRRSPERRTQ